MDGGEGDWGLPVLVRVVRGGEVTEGWGIAIEIMMVGWIFEKEAGCKCRECSVGEESCLYLEMREAVAAWRKGAGVSRALARARLAMKEAVSSLQRPPTTIPKTTKRHREFRRSSG